MVRTAALIWLALAAAPAARAESNASNGNELYENCLSSNTLSAVSCHQYIIGVVDGIQLAESVDRPDNPSFVIPAGVKGTQVKDIVIQYLRDNPDKRHWPSNFLIFNALSKTFHVGKSAP